MVLVMGLLSCEGAPESIDVRGALLGKLQYQPDLRGDPASIPDESITTPPNEAERQRGWQQRGKRGSGEFSEREK